MLRIREPRDLYFAATLVGLSLAGLWLSQELRVGTAMRMGPGYVPSLLCWIGIALGLAIGMRSLAVDGPGPGPWAWRPVLAIGAACAAFVAMPRIGLVPAVIVVTLIACLGDRTTRWGQAVLLALLLAAFAAATFVVGLKLPMPLWPPALSG